MGDGLTHPEVVERLALPVHVKFHDRGRPERFDDDVRTLHLVDGALFPRQLDDVQLAGLEREIPAAGIRQEVEVDPADFGLAEIVLVIAHQHQPLLGDVLLERERTGADGMGLDLVAELFGSLPAHDHSRLPAEQIRQQGNLGLGRIQGDADGAFVQRLDVVEPPVELVVDAGLLVSGAVQRELHIVGGELSEAAVELHALPQLERPGLEIVRVLPTLRHIRLEPLGVHLPRHWPHEATVDVIQHGLVRRVGAAHGIQDTGVGRGQPVLENAAVRADGERTKRIEADDGAADNSHALEKHASIDCSHDPSFLPLPV